MEKEQKKDWKPLSQCESVGEVLNCLAHLTKELNEIPGVKATMAIEQSEPKAHSTKE